MGKGTDAPRPGSVEEIAKRNRDAEEARRAAIKKAQHEAEAKVHRPLVG